MYAVTLQWEEKANNQLFWQLLFWVCLLNWQEVHGSETAKTRSEVIPSWFAPACPFSKAADCSIIYSTEKTLSCLKHGANNAKVGVQPMYGPDHSFRRWTEWSLWAPSAQNDLWFSVSLSGVGLRMWHPSVDFDLFYDHHLFKILTQWEFGPWPADDAQLPVGSSQTKGYSLVFRKRASKTHVWLITSNAGNFSAISKWIVRSF